MASNFHSFWLPSDPDVVLSLILFLLVSLDFLNICICLFMKLLLKFKHCLQFCLEVGSWGSSSACTWVKWLKSLGSRNFHTWAGMEYTSRSSSQSSWWPLTSFKADVSVFVYPIHRIEDDKHFWSCVWTKWVLERNKQTLSYVDLRWSFVLTHV